MSFRSIYSHGFVRVAACTHRGRVAEPAANAAAILKMLAPLHERSVAVAVFPELALSSYAIDDLLLQESLLAGVAAAVEFLVEASKDLTPLILVGAPLRHEVVDALHVEAIAGLRDRHVVRHALLATKKAFA